MNLAQAVANVCLCLVYLSSKAFTNVKSKATDHCHDRPSTPTPSLPPWRIKQTNIARGLCKLHVCMYACMPVCMYACVCPFFGMFFWHVLFKHMSLSCVVNTAWKRHNLKTNQPLCGLFCLARPFHGLSYSLSNYCL